MSVPDEGYFRKASCTLNFISTFAMTAFSETQPLQSGYILKENERTTVMVDNINNILFKVGTTNNIAKAKIVVKMNKHSNSYEENSYSTHV